jgi:hypothetical protein
MPVTTFKQWFAEHLSEYASDIANHGADAGFPHITYTRDTVEVFDQYGDEIWEMAVNVAEMISGFGRSDMLCSLDQFKNLMVWFACEEAARNFEDTNEDEEAA